MPISFISGCAAAAKAVQMADVGVIAAYPITPQTSIIEHLAKYSADAELRAEIAFTESEHAALSACVGAAMTGARAFTATAGQGLALMHEVVFYAAGLRVPMLMVVVNRSLLAPNTIYSDHQDSLAERDSGWLQFYVESCQEVFDSVLIAYKVCEDERVLLPAMVCMDGFFLSHLCERVDIPDPQKVATFLPKSSPKYPILDVQDPKLINNLVEPEFYEEFERHKHSSMLKAFEVLEEAYASFETTFGRRYEDVEGYRVEDADLVLVGMGTMAGTMSAVVDELRDQGARVGLVKVRTFRPFPTEKVTGLLAPATAVGVFDKHISFGSTGALYQEVIRSLYGQANQPLALDFIVGLGGRDVHRQTILNAVDVLRRAASAGHAEKTIYWPDENVELVRAWRLRD